jgi:hypothetical protein
VFDILLEETDEDDLTEVIESLLDSDRATESILSRLVDLTADPLVLQDIAMHMNATARVLDKIVLNRATNFYALTAIARNSQATSDVFDKVIRRTTYLHEKKKMSTKNMESVLKGVISNPSVDDVSKARAEEYLERQARLFKN